MLRRGGRGGGTRDQVLKLKCQMAARWNHLVFLLTILILKDTIRRQSKCAMVSSSLCLSHSSTPPGIRSSITWTSAKVAIPRMIMRAMRRCRGRSHPSYPAHSLSWQNRVLGLRQSWGGPFLTTIQKNGKCYKLRAYILIDSSLVD